MIPVPRWSKDLARIQVSYSAAQLYNDLRRELREIVGQVGFRKALTKHLLEQQ